MTSFAITFYFFPSTPLNSDPGIIEITVAPGSSVSNILKQLRAEKVINPFQAALLRLWIRRQGVEKKLQAGEYRFAKTIRPDTLVQKWIKGDVILYSVTIPEGVTVKECLAILNAHPKIKSITKDVLALEEGLFFPDTYYFPANTSKEVVLKMAYQAMQDKIAKAWQARSANVVLKSPFEALILASIIEKETACEEEKPLISGVFQRRLAKNIRLQADPTVVYGLKEAYSGKLTKDNLKTPTPYNTYVNLGLPPTPIALPGMRSILAALNPDQSDNLYFVAKGDGTHHFSATLAEHNEAVKKYQKEK